MWRNWNPLNPPINDQSSDDYESPPENEPNPGELVSPHRPHQSPSASPRALLRPDPPAVEEVLQEVQQQLRNLPSREQRVANRNAVREAQEAAAAAAAANDEVGSTVTTACQSTVSSPGVMTRKLSGGESVYLSILHL